MPTPEDEHDPLDPATSLEAANTVNDELSPALQTEEIGGGQIHDILLHRFVNGALQLQVLWTTGDKVWERIQDMKVDHPKLTAKYIMDHEDSINRTRRRSPHVTWAKKALRDYDRAVRRLQRLYDFGLDDDGNTVRLICCQTRRSTNNKKKKKRFSLAKRFHYGIEVPRDCTHAKELDDGIGNTFWQDAIDKELLALTKLECFEFHPRNKVLPEEYQETRLKWVFDVKNDLRRKARLVCQGQLLDILDHIVYSSVCKQILIRLLLVIANKSKLDVLSGDVGNASPTATTEEKAWFVAGKEFGPSRVRNVVVIKKALYGLASSASRWHLHFADTLRDMGFIPTRFDRDVWIRLNSDGKTYEYICSYVDDFMIFSRDTKKIMEEIQKVYTIKDDGPPEYYLGNNYKLHNGRFSVGCKKYIKDVLGRLQDIHGEFVNRRRPCEKEVHLELDQSPLLSVTQHQQYQQMIGILNWIVALGRMDIAYATASLARFVAAPRQTHLQHAKYVFGYLKKCPNKRMIVDSRDPIYEYGEQFLSRDYYRKMRNIYPNAVEEIDDEFPDPLMAEIPITVFVDADHAHDKVTRRSITGLIMMLGQTPVSFLSKRQGAIETSTYGSEFNAMRTATEEIISLRYMLRALGVHVTRPTVLIGDNNGVILNTTMSEAQLKKKHRAISYHKVREAVAAKIVLPLHTRSKFNYEDMRTKALPEKSLNYLIQGILHGS